MIRRIGVFSGTFDPFHIAHLEACLVSKAACELDTVAIIAERNPRRKEGVTDYKTRLNMIELATAGFPSIRILDADEDALTTKKTLPILHDQFGEAELWYILGSDLVMNMTDWPEIDELIDNFKLCVILRSNKDRSVVEAQLEILKDRHYNLNYKILPEVWSPVSSSVIRDQIKKSGFSPYLHRDVLKYVIKNDVY